MISDRWVKTLRTVIVKLEEMGRAILALNLSSLKLWVFRGPQVLKKSTVYKGKGDISLSNCQ